MEEMLPEHPASPEIGPAPIIPINQAASEALLSQATTRHNTQRLAILPGFLPEQNLRLLLQTQNFVDAPQSLPDIHDLWETAQRARKRLPRVYPPAGNIVGDIPTEFAGYEQQLMQREVYLRWYQPFFACRLRLIAVKRLVTPQYYINRDYVDALLACAPEPGDMASALAFAFEFGAPVPDPVLSGGVLIFRSAETHLVPIPPLEYRRVGPDEVEVIQRVQARPNLFQVARLSNQPGIDDLLIVMNGVHRAAALILKGWEYVPALLRTALTYPDHQLSPEPGIIPQAEVVNARPPYVSDLLDPGVATEFRQRVTEQGLKVGAQFELFGMPA